jgi:hypothetical protein
MDGNIDRPRRSTRTMTQNYLHRMVIEKRAQSFEVGSTLFLVSDLHPEGLSAIAKQLLQELFVASFTQRHTLCGACVQRPKRITSPIGQNFEYKQAA